MAKSKNRRTVKRVSNSIHIDATALLEFVSPELKNVDLKTVSVKKNGTDFEFTWQTVEQDRLDPEPAAKSAPSGSPSGTPTSKGPVSKTKPPKK